MFFDHFLPIFYFSSVIVVMFFWCLNVFSLAIIGITICSGCMVGWCYFVVGYKPKVNSHRFTIDYLDDLATFLGSLSLLVIGATDYVSYLIYLLL